jgi:hypothetical protein
MTDFRSRQTTCQQAIAILSLTRDGDDLAPRHLKLLEMAVNNFLSDAGQEAFAELHRIVLSGHYDQKKP